MRKASTLVGLILVVLGATARAEESAPVAVQAPPPSTVGLSPRRLEVGASVLAMGLGQVTSFNGAMVQSQQATFAYGASLSVSYRIIAGLSVGLAPQVIYGVAAKEEDGLTEYNVLAKIAYAFPVVENVSLYGEVLPGYSLKMGSKKARGPVVGVQAGVLMDLSDRTFANLGVGYQLGYQNIVLGPGAEYEDRENYLRVELGGGVRF